MTPEKPVAWRNRIVGHELVDPKTLTPHPLNFREGTKAQLSALERFLGLLGWIDEVTVNRTTGTMIDGHKRLKEALETGQALVPVKYVELTLDEERQALALLDTIAAMSDTRADRLAELLPLVTFDDPDLSGVLQNLAISTGLGFDLVGLEGTYTASNTMQMLGRKGASGWYALKCGEIMTTVPVSLHDRIYAACQQTGDHQALLIKILETGMDVHDAAAAAGVATLGGGA